LPGGGWCAQGALDGAGQGKRGGVRVIYFNRSASGAIYLVALYCKSARADMRPQQIPQVDP